MNYRKDRIGAACLAQAEQGRSSMGFGAVLVKNGKIIASGRNRRATAEDRTILSNVDYAVHAEEACIIDAKRRGIMLDGSELHVLGVVLKGLSEGSLTTRRQRYFTCVRCAKILVDLRLPVAIPLQNGWATLNPEFALATAQSFTRSGHWRNFAQGQKKL